LQNATWPDLIERIRARTPARVAGGAGGRGLPYQDPIELRQAHAAARDAVRTELDLEKDLGTEFVARWKLFEASTQALSKDEYLLRPDRADDSATTRSGPSKPAVRKRLTCRS